MNRQVKQTQDTHPLLSSRRLWGAFFTVADLQTPTLTQPEQEAADVLR